MSTSRSPSATVVNADFGRRTDDLAEVRWMTRGGGDAVASTRVGGCWWGFDVDVDGRVRDTADVRGGDSGRRKPTATAATKRTLRRELIAVRMSMGGDFRMRSSEEVNHDAVSKPSARAGR
jgi:hypothetical protein